MGSGIELTARGSDGSEFPVEVSLTPVGGSADLVIALVSDITDRCQMERELRERDLFFRLAPDLFCISTADGTLLQVNPAFTRLLGWSADHLTTGNFIDRFVHADDRDAFRTAFRRLGRDSNVEAIRNRVLTRDGAVRWLEWSTAAIAPTSDHIFGVARDVSAEVAAEARLHALTAQLFTAQEDERRRLAMEFHDDLTQRVAAIGIEVGMVRRRVESEEAGAALAAVQEQVASLTQYIRLLSHGLHPSSLEYGGLAAALEQHTQEITRESGLPVRCVFRDVPEAIPEPAGIVAYRIVQEALRNVQRHAEATSACVMVSGEDGGIMLLVMDDGRGFDVDRARTVPGIGLDSMRERARLLGGRMSISSEPGEGTRVEVHLPVSQKGEPEQCPAPELS
jgi:two-component system sensor histidine kinase UhpB